MKEISSARILECSRSTAGPGIFNYQMRSINEKPHLVKKLCEYNVQIGIDRYTEYDDGSVVWHFQNNWYSTDQVAKLIKLKAFA